jgi:hypothetical protein
MYIGASTGTLGRVVGIGTFIQTLRGVNDSDDAFLEKWHGKLKEDEKKAKEDCAQKALITVPWSSGPGNDKRRVGSPGDVMPLFVRDGLGFLRKTMNRPTDPSTDDQGMSRSAWVVYTLLFALYLLKQFVQWDRTWTTLDTLLFPALLVVMSLSHVFQLKGNVRRLVDVLLWAVVILAFTMSLIF